ncbi:MAG TPA: hypothetical protein PLT09_03825 [Deltaproteobacteria bacterium]|nr:hypothetical protein [Deltaproteobacteria bacterium]HPR54833.1 hypothetical protein [Deltaproteobacteria bacterium]HXK46542.1 hypothetical protein [Deltaproteobacteria bacterium]
MKIDPNKIIGTMVSETVKPSAGARGAFEDVLKGLETETAAKAGSVQASFTQLSISPQKLQAVGASEDALELLESYSQAVGDPQVSLKELAPMVDEMEAMKARVDGAASFISDDDPLKGIMNDVSAALDVEVLKFRRGDLIG